MREVVNYRKQHRRAAIRSLGVSAETVRGWTSEVEALGAEAAILALPFMGGSAVLATEDQPLQDAAGTPYFMAGASEVSGADPVA